ncbi:NCS2 family permease [Micromonospora yangpuensis]|uniref:Putative MFS transporter, AGZA family, xanthine/uracil permease n=1 Tax=Micromonospora yangpuensis TaxID=683228 RepID=A0A1C6U0P8_9ACTN|nr:NCS2 family permease [Micromonospora yangpuensis]GGM11554.1 MFS transporter [Micromonospora yangpuensis]SCL47616.1 putative MFS transporter, AGZA family, xanthine/uracil permease [Micromonospora yangpuensis]
MAVAPPENGTPPEPARPRNGFDRYFEISARGSTLSREVRGGLATFFTMAYIVVLNPLILGAALDGDGQSLAIPALAAATALLAGLMTILMGVVGRFPLAVAAGLGVNALVAYEIAPEMTWADAMGLVVIEGLIIGVLVLTGLRTAVFRSVPTQMKTAIGVGIGLFLTIIGLVDAGFVRRIPDAANTTVPVGLGIGGKLVSWPMLVFVVGLLLTLVLVVRRVRGAILIGILVSTGLAIVIQALFNVGPSVVDGVANPKGWSLNVPELPSTIVDVPDLSLLGNFNVLDSWGRAGWLVVLMFVFTLLITDFFDTMGTMVAVGQEGSMLDEQGTPPRAKEILLVDSIGAMAGGAASVSSNTAYVESAAGVAEGARTGAANLVTGALFLLAMFFAPLVLIVPFEAASTALVVVGFLMMTAVRTIDWSDYEIAVPAFLTIVLMPFTYSISNGIGAGLITYVVVKLAKGKAREVHPLLYGVALVFVLYFLRGPIESALL